MGPVWTLGSGYETLMGYEFAPKEERAISLKGRISATPEFLKNAEAILDTMPAPHIETTIAQCDGLISVMEDELPLFIEDLDLELAENLKRSAEKASEATALRTRFPFFGPQKVFAITPSQDTS